MFTKRIATTLAFAVVVAALSAQPAAAAQTRTLPDGEIFYAVECQDSLGVLASVDVLTSVATVIGSNVPSPNTGCAGPAAWDATTGTMYWTSWGNDDTLMVVDIETGQSTEVDQFMDGSFMIGSDGIAIDNLGNAYLLDQGDETGLGDGRTPGTKLYSLDLTTAQATFIANVEGMNDPGACVAAFAFNPADGGFYANCETDSGVETLAKIDVTDGTTTVACTWSHGIWGLAFDSNGIAWVPDAGNTNLVSYDVSLGGSCGEEVGTPIQVNGVGWYTGSNVIATPLIPNSPVSPEPELPATGISPDRLTAPALVAALAFVLAGGFMALRHVARRKA